MNHILLKEDGNINEEKINEYIDSYGINTPYNDHPDSIYNQQTLLYIAVSSNEISPDTKLRLASHLLSKEAEVNNKSIAKMGRLCELLVIAIKNKNFELANLLLKNGADIVGVYKKQNLIDIALDLKDKDALLWVLQNAKPLFLTLKLNKFNDYYQKIIAAFPDYQQNELNIPLNKIVNDYTDHTIQGIKDKFSRLGRINFNDVPLILAAKMGKKTYQNSIFVITNDDGDIPNLIEQIKNLLNNNTTENVIKFQIIHFPGAHAIFGEFVIDKTKNPPLVTYLHCDPMPGLTKYNEIITSEFAKEIIPLANIEIYDSYVTIQKGIGCSYFSIDGAMLLATPSDRPYVTNLNEYMKKHSNEEDNVYKHSSIKYMKCTSLPTRLIRGMQYIDDSPLTSRYITGLNSLVFNTEEKNTIVNKKGQTAEQSIREDLQERPVKDKPEEMRIFNIRAERKMMQYKTSVLSFMRDNNITDPGFANLLDQYKMMGLTQFCQAKISQKNERKMGI